jgi:hypothetical protein
MQRVPPTHFAIPATLPHTPVVIVEPTGGIETRVGKLEADVAVLKRRLDPASENNPRPTKRVRRRTFTLAELKDEKTESGRVQRMLHDALLEAPQYWNHGDGVGARFTFLTSDPIALKLFASVMRLLGTQAPPRDVLLMTVVLGVPIERHDAAEWWNMALCFYPLPADRTETIKNLWRYYSHPQADASKVRLLTLLQLLVHNFQPWSPLVQPLAPSERQERSQDILAHLVLNEPLSTAPVSTIHSVQMVEPTKGFYQAITGLMNTEALLASMERYFGAAAPAPVPKPASPDKTVIVIPETPPLTANEKE